MSQFVDLDVPFLYSVLCKLTSKYRNGSINGNFFTFWPILTLSLNTLSLSPSLWGSFMHHGKWPWVWRQRGKARKTNVTAPCLFIPTNWEEDRVWSPVSHQPITKVVVSYGWGFRSHAWVCLQRLVDLLMSSLDGSGRWVCMHLIAFQREWCLTNLLSLVKVCE